MYAKEIALAVFDGVISIPSDLVHGARRTYEDFGGRGNANRNTNLAENKRIS